MNDDTMVSDQDTNKSSLTFRIVVLGSVYALAVLFAVVFSPSMSVAPHHPAGAGNVASVEPVVRH
ncbi:MAG: hypothetical protein H7Y60_06710 [Rhodospirillaceae bacterium]|nr:hypothetical protein [Rhodospirillales bacterium]